MIDGASDADARFDRAAERWFRDRLALEPELATSVGIHDRDHELSSATRDHVDELADFHRASIAEMERFGSAELSPDRVLDRDLLIHEGRLHLFELTERRSWAGASGAAEQIGDALFPLMSREFAPFADRLASMAARLEAAPRYLLESRSRVEAPVHLWIEMDIEATRQLPAFLDAIVAAARAERVEPALAERLETVVGATRDALAAHDAWLRTEVLPEASGMWCTGPDAFEEMLGLRALGASSAEILAVGEQILADETAARDAVSAEIDPTLSPHEISHVVKDDHPATFAEALDAYREAMGRARDFVVEHELATFPEHDTLRVMETPTFLRHTMPFAAYYEPAKFDPEPTGTYIVTPPSHREMMREHNYASISNTSVHEAYPGHHLQLSAAISNPSLVRLLATSAAEFAEGWAFYCERLMKDLGFDDTPTHRYIQHTDAIWRACRIVLDVRLHRGEIGVAEAVRYLTRHTGFERAAALAEVKRYTTAPTYQLSYLYGRHLIDELKTDVQRAMGPAFNLRFFHDRMLYGGTIPVAFARRLFDLSLGGLPS